MNTRPVIRMMHAGDIKPLCALLHTQPERLQQYLFEQKQGERIVLVAEYEQEVVGYGTLQFASEDSKFSTRRIPEIIDLNVAVQYQNKGIGTALIQAFETHARRDGWAVIGIGVELEPQYAAAQHLYRKLGYLPIEGVAQTHEWSLYKRLEKGKIAMQWHQEPARWEANGNTITVTTDPKTDFWRKTHYGFIRDNGHFYGEPAPGDFTAEVKFTGQYRDLYDQAGIMVRHDETCWMKCGIEYVNGVQNASVVVTRDYSDWSVVPLGGNPQSLWLRVKRMSGSVEVFYSLDGEHYTMIRTAYLTEGHVDVGIMCASPEGEGFTTVFEGWRLE